ncbi:hypothetical protein [Paenibacillus thiaminolyticus]|uniref:hypothetical protein n=1 Tax=Paenibacillus thiaminolyticus TaxID=49283 RepID=UPI001C720FF1|nr:hypothetical protein [Paenibacillus thiaminolyticus]
MGEYAALLEAVGFHVDMAVHFKRPTALPDGDAGMDYWLESFAKPFVHAVGEKESGRLFRLVKERCRPSLYSGDDGPWTMQGCGSRRIRRCANEAEERERFIRLALFSWGSARSVRTEA